MIVEGSMVGASGAMARAEITALGGDLFPGNEIHGGIE